MGASGKNKLINATPFHKRSAIEVSDHFPQAFPCNKGKTFEDVNHVVWLLWTIAWERKPWILHIIAINTLNCTSLCQSSGPALLVGKPHEMWPVLASPREPEDTFQQGNLTCCWKGSYLLPVWKTSQSCHITWGFLPSSFGNRKKGIADLLRFISSLSQAKCWVHPGLGAGVEIMLPVENLFAKDDSRPFLSCFLLSVHSKLPYSWEIKLFRRAKQSKKQGPLGHARHWKQSSVFGDLYHLTYSCSSQNANSTWFINCSCFPHRPRRLEWDQAVTEGPSS